MFYVIGLGNPGEEYDNTRHNTGRMAAQFFAKANNFGEFEFDKFLNAELSQGKIGEVKVTVTLPDTFMNKSGAAVMKIKDLRFKIKEKKRICDNLIVIHDDLDIPFGKMKISFNKSSGGHKGVESVIKAVKTEAFIRVRIGISPITSAGKLKKPQGDDVVGNFILAKFKTSEQTEFQKIMKNSAEAIGMIIEEGKEKAMGKWNSA